jgi:hypothetical protein
MHPVAVRSIPVFAGLVAGCVAVFEGDLVVGSGVQLHLL